MKLTTRTVLVFLAMFLWVVTSPAQNDVVKTDAQRRPNILLIISDDIGMDVTSDMYPGMIDDLVRKYGPSGHNHPDYRKIDDKPASTPVLDKLSRQGMRFTHVWAHPFCSPTRATLLTGLYAAKTRVATYADALSPKHTSFVQQLKDDGGYSTAVFGKWHIAGLAGRDPYPGMKPKQAGFDLFKGNRGAAINTFWQHEYVVQDDETPADQWRDESLPEKSLPGIAPTTYAPVVKAADTIEWIKAKNSENPDKPWFVWLAFNLSHATASMRPSQMCVPNADTLDEKSYKEMKECGGTFGTNIVGSCSGEALMRAMTNSMDTVIGKILDVVDTIPNTYVIYISDNGTPMYGRPNLDFIENMYITRKERGKGTAYESGALVPMIVRGPKIKADTRNDAHIHVADLFSTTLELAGLTPPEYVSNSDGTGTVPVDAVSLTPILFNNAKNVRDPNTGYILTESENLMKQPSVKIVGAQNATYKVVCSVSADNCTFYNIVDDPLEEYPLDKPESCADYTSGKWTPEDPQWHYCRLMEVVTRDSLMAADK